MPLSTQYPSCGSCGTSTLQSQECGTTWPSRGMRHQVSWYMLMDKMKAQSFIPGSFLDQHQEFHIGKSNSHSDYYEKFCVDELYIFSEVKSAAFLSQAFDMYGEWEQNIISFIANLCGSLYITHMISVLMISDLQVHLLQLSVSGRQREDITGVTTDFLNDTCFTFTQEQLSTKPVLECSGLNASTVTVTLRGNNLACVTSECVKDSTVVIATVAVEVDEDYRSRCGLICDVEYPVYCEVISSSGPESCSYQCDCTPRKCGRWLALLGTE